MNMLFPRELQTLLAAAVVATRADIVAEAEKNVGIQKTRLDTLLKHYAIAQQKGNVSTSDSNNLLSVYRQWKEAIAVHEQFSESEIVKEEQEHGTFVVEI